MCEATSFSPLKQRCRCFRILRTRTRVSLCGRPLAVVEGEVELAQRVRRGLRVQRARRVLLEIRVRRVRPPRALGLVVPRVRRVARVRMEAQVLSAGRVPMVLRVPLARSVQRVRRVRLEREQPCRSSP